MSDAICTEIPQNMPGEREIADVEPHTCSGSVIWVQGPDLNRGPSGYEPDELPDCSTLQQERG